MAKETNLELRLERDFAYDFTILNAAESAAEDIAGWGLSFMVKRHTSDADAAALLTKTTPTGIVISGTWNATPSVNTQIATVTIADTDTTSVKPGAYFYELERTDAGLETTLAYGVLECVQGVQR